MARRKRTVSAPSGIQRALFRVEGKAPAAPRRRLSEESFLEDDPRELTIGEKRLDAYLEGVGQRWVVRLRTALEAMDYGLLMEGSSHRGRKRLHPRVLLGLVVYGMLQRQWSLRDLEALARRDLGAWWICGGHQPDHSTIGNFINAYAHVLSEDFFRELIGTLVRRLGLQRGTVAGDGTVIEAAAGGIKRLRAEAARECANQARRAADAEPDDGALDAHAQRAEEIAEVVEQRSEERRSHGRKVETIQVAPSEPCAVVQLMKDDRYRPSYKPSIWVHQSGLIVGQALDPSSETASLETLKEQHDRAFGDLPLHLLLDAGYHCLDVIEEFANTDLLCPAGRRGAAHRATGKSLYGKHLFRYETERDAYVCPAGKDLLYIDSGHAERGGSYRRYRGIACQGCTQRPQCTVSPKGRTVRRYEREELREAMAVVMAQPGAQRKYRERAFLAEAPFSVLKDRQGLRRFHRRGRSGARVEFALHCMAFDLGKVAHRGSILLAQALFISPSRDFAISIHFCVLNFPNPSSPACIRAQITLHAL